MSCWSYNRASKLFGFRPNRCNTARSTVGSIGRSRFRSCWFVSAVATADAIISLSCAGEAGMLRVGSETVFAVDVDEEEEDVAPELFLVLRVAIRRDSSSASQMLLDRP